MTAPEIVVVRSPAYETDRFEEVAMNLSYRVPLTAVLLRRLAWEHYVAGRELTLDDIKEKHLPAARQELGLSPITPTDPAVDKYLRSLHRAPKRPVSDGQTEQLVGSKWDKESEWRWHYLPGHDSVRHLSMDPVCTQTASATGNDSRSWEVLLRDPAVPKLRITVGPELSISKPCKNKQGVYFIRWDEQLYIGQSTDLGPRIAQHKSEGDPQWTAAIALEESSRSISEELNATEALLISFWDEVAELGNTKYGARTVPVHEHRQRGVVLAKGASAALVWLLREKADLGLPEWTIPFKKWQAAEWPACYLRPGGPE